MNDHILVVESNVDLGEDVCEILGETGARVSLATDGPAALARATDQRVDLAIVSVRLGVGESGLELLPELRAKSPHGEIVVMSGAATLHSALEAVRHGVFGYLPKPFDPPDLVRLAARALASVSVRRERTELSRELARSEALHRAVFDTVESLVIGLDAQQRVCLWNRRAADVTGWSLAQAQGQRADTLLFAADDGPALARLLAAANEREGGNARLELRTREGARRAVQWRTQPLEAGSEHERVVLLMGTDLTEQIALRARAAEAEAMAAMGRLTSALAHEIRNPLNAAMLQAELIRRSAERFGEPEIERRTGIVTEELRRLTTLLNDFLGLARPAALEQRAVDVTALARDVFALHEPSAAEAGIELRLEIGEALPPIEGDTGRLKQALINLVVNALDATAEGGGSLVSIETRRDADALVILVEDDGPGLAESPSEALQPFHTTKEGGTGLGLAIVERVARMHGGTVALRPRAGGGTVAALRLPDASGGSA